jgi:hypothetical protein
VGLAPADRIEQSWTLALSFADFSLGTQRKVRCCGAPAAFMISLRADARIRIVIARRFKKRGDERKKAD